MTNEKKALLIAIGEGVKFLVKNALDKGVESELMIRRGIDSHLALVVALDCFTHKEVE